MIDVKYELKVLRDYVLKVHLDARSRAGESYPALDRYHTGYADGVAHVLAHLDDLVLEVCGDERTD